MLKFQSILLFSLIFLTGCAKSDFFGKAKLTYSAERLSTNDKNTVKTIEDNNRTSFSDERVLLITDNQEVLINTFPIFEQSKFSEKSVNTAHRRPALDAFSINVVDMILERSAAANNDDPFFTDYNLIIHGGDLMNNSCVQEFENAVEILDRERKGKKRPWFMAPGNHDGFLLGISMPRSISKGFWKFNIIQDERAQWAKVCTQINQKISTDKEQKRVTSFGLEHPIKDYALYDKYILEKAGFIGYYLKAINVLDQIKQEKVATFCFKNSNNQCLKYDSVYNTDRPDEYTIDCIDFKKLHKGYMSNICWSRHSTQKPNQIDPKEFRNQVFAEKIKKGKYETQYSQKYPWANFVIQKLEVNLNDKKTIIIIVDTASYVSNRAIKKSGFFKPRGGAADYGEISAVQGKIIEAWLKEYDEPANDMDIVFVGHHPLKELDIESFNRIKKWLHGNKKALYISGDTHDGFNVKWPLKNSKSDDVTHEVNIGSTTDAPIEYAYLGKNGDDEKNDDVKLIKHFSLTPPYKTGKTDKPKSGKKLKRLNKNTEKNYIQFNTDVWDMECSEINNYYKDVSPYDSLNLLGKKRNSTELLFRDININQAGVVPYFGIPYINFLGLREVRLRALYAYKINRMIYLAEVYNQLFPNVLDAKLINEAQEVIQELKRKNFKAFYIKRDKVSPPDKELFRKSLYQLDKLITAYQEYDSNTNDTAEITMKKVCSALYDAEREYDASWFTG